MNPNEISILSDDLRPRDSPNHTLLKDFVLKPMVPDLSITEEPGSEEPFFHNRCQQPVVINELSHPGVVNRQKSLLEEYKTYNEWRKKSAINAKPQPTVNHSHDNSCVHVNGVASPTVLDNLNSSVVPQAHNGHSIPSFDRRPSTDYFKDSQVNGTSSKASRTAPRIASQKSCGVGPVHMNSQRRDSHCVSSSAETFQQQDSSPKVPGRKSYKKNPADGNLSHSSKHFVSNHPDTPNCTCCAHWPHQPMTAINYNGMPVFHSYPHVGLPPCSAMPVTPSSPLPVPLPKSRSVSQHSGVVPGHSFSDSVVYDNLYQMVLSQSEQLKSLQTQVEKLLISQENHRCNGSPTSKRGNRNTKSTTVMERGTQTSDGESNADDCEKMSIGVMTSFNYTVAYAGRVGLVDSKNKGLNQPNRSLIVDARNKMPNSHSTSPPSQAQSTSLSSSRSDSQVSPPSETQNNCCKCRECIDKEKENQKKKQRGNTDNVDWMREAGASVGLRTLRGCQATIRNQYFPNDGNNGQSDGLDSIRVEEQHVSSSSSIHIDMQEYDGSSLEESSSSDDEFSSSSKGDVDDCDTQVPRPNGWNSYSNILGPLNYIPENKDSAKDFDRGYGSRKRKGRRGRKERENRPPRSAANGVQGSILKRVSFQHESKSTEENPIENLKQLALNYLRENHPEELASTEGCFPSSKPSDAHKRVQDMALYNCGNNMSTATYRYLERFDLLPDNAEINGIEVAGFGQDELPPNVENREALTNGSPTRGPHGNGVAANGVAAHFEQYVNIGQYGMRTINGRDCWPSDRASRPHFPRRKEKHNPAHYESPSGRKQSSVARHGRHYQTNPLSTMPIGQQMSSTSKILDITALRQQPKLKP